MKGEVGFVLDDQNQVTQRLKLRVSATSGSEATLLQMFAERTGMPFDSTAAAITIEEPVKAGVR